MSFWDNKGNNDGENLSATALMVVRICPRPLVGIGFRLVLVQIIENLGATSYTPAAPVYKPCELELVSKELNHLAAILHVYAGGLNFMK